MSDDRLFNYHSAFTGDDSTDYTGLFKRTEDIPVGRSAKAGVTEVETSELEDWYRTLDSMTTDDIDPRDIDDLRDKIYRYLR